MSSFNEESGYGPPVPTSPPYATPSSWVQSKHDLDQRLNVDPLEALLPEMSHVTPHVAALRDALCVLRSLEHDFVNFEAIRLRSRASTTEFSYLAHLNFASAGSNSK